LWRTGHYGNQKNGTWFFSMQSGGLFARRFGCGLCLYRQNRLRKIPGMPDGRCPAEYNPEGWRVEGIPYPGDFGFFLNWDLIQD
jgi:hypothetical protein